MCKEGSPCKCKKCDCAYLFVYGTLKKGGKLNPQLVQHQKLEFGSKDGELLHPAKMYNLGEFPGILLTEGEETESKIKGEVVKIKKGSLPFFDYIETAAYRREQLDVVLSGSGEVLSCWVYIINDYVADYYNIRDSKSIESGLWEN